MASFYFMKVYFSKKSRKDAHIRIFEIDISSEKQPYEELCNKITTGEPDFQVNGFRVKYIDEEKERITFSSNEELRTAIKMKSDSKPLKIIVAGNKPKTTTTTTKDHEEGECRSGMICNRCERTSVNTCHKCSLCENCSSSSVHFKDAARRATKNACLPTNWRREQLKLKKIPKLSKRHLLSESSDVTSGSTSDEEESSSSGSSGSTLNPPPRPLKKSKKNEREKQEFRMMRPPLPPGEFNYSNNVQVNESTRSGCSADASASSTRRSEETSLDGAIRFLETYRLLQQN